MPPDSMRERHGDTCSRAWSNGVPRVAKSQSTAPVRGMNETCPQSPIQIAGWRVPMKPSNCASISL